MSSLSNFRQRALTALVAGTVAIAAISCSAWSYFALFLLVLVKAMLEFYQLARLQGVVPAALWGTLSSLLLYLLVFVYATGWLEATALYVLVPVLTLMFPAALYRKGSASPFTDIAYTLLGVIYVGAPFALLHLVAFWQGAFRAELVLGIVVLLWANDTGAYLVGSCVGRRKLFERISPQKTWEGSVGGGIFVLAIGCLLARFFPILGSVQWLGMGVIVVVAGTYGDLVESMLKRSVQVKDSGTAIPGHGGMLDRFDSFLLAVPLIVAFLRLGT
ncbi:MAG: phosphatidate cytidylyltransferase [Bacteroidota bacterium]